MGEEGCLSIPGFREQVRRAKRVTIRAQNAKGEEFEKTGEDLLARAFLHETEHLNGRLYITHISALKRDLMKRKIKTQAGWTGRRRWELGAGCSRLVGGSMRMRWSFWEHRHSPFLRWSAWWRPGTACWRW